MGDPNIFSFPTIGFSFMMQQPEGEQPRVTLPPLPAFPVAPVTRSHAVKAEEPQVEEEEPKKGKTNTACPHKDRKHYAKGMCNNCYHKKGRKKLAQNCPHKDRPLYARGKCQFCYLHQYHKTRVVIHRRTKKYKTI